MIVQIASGYVCIPDDQVEVSINYDALVTAELGGVSYTPTGSLLRIVQSYFTEEPPSES
jgi:hypothetical protein